MDKKIIIGSESANELRSVVDVQPASSTILVEMLNNDELLNTKLTINTDNVGSPPQGYVLAFGPKLKEEDAGFKVGSRVVLQGSYVPVPNVTTGTRKRGIVELHNIKAVLIEE